MTDERIDALIRRLDVPSGPDPEFVTATVAILLPRVRIARAQDMSRTGRLRRVLALADARARWLSLSRPIAIVGFVVLLLLALVAVAVAIIGYRNRPILISNGPLIVAVQGELRAIDEGDGSIRVISPPGALASHVSHSPDGRLVAYWTLERGGGDRLGFMGIDGQGLRVVALGHTVTRAGCVDTWSPDSRYLASEVKVDGASRILVADSMTGTGRFVTPDGVIGHCPLWSPDGQSIAFAQETDFASRLAIIRVDGSGLAGVSGDLGGADVAGANTWSADGRWVYFTTAAPEGSIWRADIALHISTRLTRSPGFATAVASSPDGALISYTIATSSPFGWDLYVAESDGSDARRILVDAMNLGWSADGRYILARWAPDGRPGGIALVTTDGTDVRVIVPDDQSCLDPAQVCDVGWGQARP